MERIGRKARKESKAKEKVSGRRTVARRVAKEANLQARRQERKAKAQGLTTPGHMPKAMETRKQMMER